MATIFLDCGEELAPFSALLLLLPFSVDDVDAFELSFLTPPDPAEEEEEEGPVRRDGALAEPPLLKLPPGGRRKARLVLAARGEDVDGAMYDDEEEEPPASGRPPRGVERLAGPAKGRSRGAEPLRRAARALRPEPVLPEGGGGGRARILLLLLLVRATPLLLVLPLLLFSGGPAPVFDMFSISSSICLTRDAVAACLARAEDSALLSVEWSLEVEGSALLLPRLLLLPLLKEPASVPISLRKSAAWAARAVYDSSASPVSPDGGTWLLRCASEEDEKEDTEEVSVEADGRREGPPAPARDPSAPLEAVLAAAPLAAAPLRAAATRAATALRVEVAERGDPGSVLVFFAESRFQEEEEEEELLLLLLLLRGGVFADASA